MELGMNIMQPDISANSVLLNSSYREKDGYHATV
jgi:hypothetical protein